MTKKCGLFLIILAVVSVSRNSHGLEHLGSEPFMLNIAG